MLHAFGGGWPPKPLHVYWCPATDADWPQAYGSSIPNRFPAGTNADWTFDVDCVRVERIGADAKG